MRFVLLAVQDRHHTRILLCECKTWNSQREKQSVVLHKGWHDRHVDEFEQEQWIHGFIR